MIKALIIVSMNGQPRLSKFYDYIDMDKRKDIIRKIDDVVVKRSDKLCNFVEEKSLQFWNELTKAVYRKVSSICVCIVADEKGERAGLLDLIQGGFVFFSLMGSADGHLDESFDGLREYDLICNIDKWADCSETNVDKIKATINAKNSLEYKMEDSSGRLPTVK
ncbi:hypothetical protein WA538_000699 [Blastocystis sp. DL]